MLLAVDIGNTLTKFGVFDDDILVSKFAVPTHSNDLVADINGRIDSGFDAAVICSVVPDAAERLHRLVTNGFGVEPTFVTDKTALGLKIKHTPASSLGTDRLVNSFAAAEKYGVPVIVCSFGTATTIDVVNENRELLGGLIAPGMPLMAKCLNQSTASLPLVEIASIDRPLGRTTEDAIRSGIFLSVVGLVETSVARILDSIGDATVIATGGFSEMIADECSCIDTVDADLTLEGLKLITTRRRSAKT